METLAIIKDGLSHEHLTYGGRFYSFESLPMYLRPLQQPYPPLWYMRNPVTAAMEGMHTIIVGSLDGLAAAVPRYRAAWEEHQGSGTLTVQGQEPMIGLVVHLVVAETNEEAMAAAKPAWEKYAGTSRRRAGSRPKAQPHPVPIDEGRFVWLRR